MYIVQYFLTVEILQDIVCNVQNSLIIMEEEEVGGLKPIGGMSAIPSVTHLLLGIKARTGVIDDQIGQNG